MSKKYPSKQYLNEVISNREFAESVPPEIVIVMARQLLSGMEQEPAAWIAKSKATGEIELDEPHAIATNPEYWTDAFPVYAAPQLPQPAVVPPEYATPARADNEWQSGYCIGWNACLAAMLQGAEPVSQPYTLREGVAAIRNSGIAIDAEKIQAERDALNEPDVPDGYALVPVDMTPEQMRAVQLNSELGAYAAANLTGAYSLFREFWGVACSAAGNYPATPEGYVLVPIEPTAEMCDVKHVGVDVYTGIAADEYYSIGGEDAAKVWKAMLAAAPKPEVNREMD